MRYFPMVAVLAVAGVLAGCRHAQPRARTTAATGRGTATATATGDGGGPTAAVETKSAPARAARRGKNIDDGVVIGKTTKDEITTRFGRPDGSEKDISGTETISYDREHITGKAFIPYYFGSDHYRTYSRSYTFDTNHVLINSKDFERHRMGGGSKW